MMHSSTFNPHIQRKFSLSPAAFICSTAVMLLNIVVPPVDTRPLLPSRVRPLLHVRGHLPVSSFSAASLGQHDCDIEGVKEGDKCCVM